MASSGSSTGDIGYLVLGFSLHERVYQTDDDDCCPGEVPRGQSPWAVAGKISAIRRWMSRGGGHGAVRLWPWVQESLVKGRRTGASDGRRWDATVAG